MVVEAIIFDFDGTIVDTETPDFQVWQEFYRAHGMELSIEFWKQRVGKAVFDGAVGIFDPARHFETLTGIQLDLEVVREQYRHYLDLCAEQILLPGVMEILQRASQRGIKLAVASNSDRPWIDQWVDHFGLRHYFTCIYTRDDVVHPKPAPDIYLDAAACLGVPVERCIAIEDSPIGMEAVNAAGIRCVAVPNYLTAHLERPKVALTLHTLADIDFSTLLSIFE